MNIYLKEFIDKKFQEPGKALDLGAGDFFDVASLKQVGWVCEGVDIKTGVDLEKPFKSESAPFDLVYSNYLFQRLKNRKQLVNTAYDNLKPKGWFFLHTFDKSDEIAKTDITTELISKLLEEGGFKNIETRIIDFYDNDIGHNHWHRILEATAQK